MKYKEAISIAHKHNLNSIEARSLLKYILNRDDNYIIVNLDKDLTEKEENIFSKYVIKISKGYPLQYITNMQEFMGLKFYVDENVLIPQPDTEILVLNAISYIKEMNEKIKKEERIKVLDLCTGSGAIAISIKKYLNEMVDVTGSDISKQALKVASKNALDNSVNIKFLHSNMFNSIKEKYDLIVSNPPYIKKEEITRLPKEVQNEPYIALNGGDDGLDYYKIIKQNVKNYLVDNGVVMMEIGYDQKADVQRLFQNSKCIKDLENRDRVVIWNPFQAK